MTGPDAPTTTGQPALLKRNAIRLPEIIMQALAAFAPAFSIVLLFQLTVAESGVTAPLVFFFAGLIVLMLGASISQLYKAFPSAGGFYTHISRTVHPRAGFMAGWLMSIWLPPAGVLVVAYTAQSVLQPQINAQYGVNIPWWVYVLAIGAFVGFLIYRGIVISKETVVALGVAEIVICVVLGIFALFSPGRGGVNLIPFNPAHAPSLQGLYLGVVFSIFVYTGWETQASMAEEAKNPRRNVLLGTVGAIAIWAAFLVFCTWAYLVGVGTSNIGVIVKSGTLPPLDLAHHLWGGAWVILLLAILNSAIAVSIVCSNASTRIWYGMARSGVLPAALSKLHRTHKTPVNAIYLELVISLVTLAIAAIFGPSDTFTVYSLMSTFGLIVIYCMLNLGVVRHYLLGPGRSEFNWLLHLVFPVLSSAAVLWVGYKSVVPLPPAPAKYAPLVTAGCVAVGVAALIWMRARGKETWLAKAGEGMDESSDLPLEPRPATATAGELV